MTEAFYSHPLFPNAGRMTCLCDLMRSTEECAQLFSHFQVLSCMPVTCCAGLFFTGAKWSRERIFWESTYFNSPCSARRFPRHSIWLAALPMFFLRWVFLQSIRLNRTQGNQNESILQYILIGLSYARTWGAQQFKCLEAYKNTDLKRKSWGVSCSALPLHTTRCQLSGIPLLFTQEWASITATPLPYLLGSSYHGSSFFLLWHCYAQQGISTGANP